MPTKLTHELLLHNLDRIFNADNECLHKDNFITPSGGRLRDSVILIEYLVQHDLIEVEDDPTIYFLTTLGYDVQEGRFWYDLYEDDSDPVFERKGNAFESQEDLNQKKPIRFSPLIKGSIVAGMVTTFSYFFGIQIEESKRGPIPVNEIEGIIIQTDSLGNKSIRFSEPN